MNLKHTFESGRSMVEMLGTLAIMGILSITAIVGFRYAMDKLNANRIYNDVSMAYVALNTSETAPYHWESTQFRPDSGYALSVRRDKANNDFVLVDKVEDDICDMLLDMAEDSGEVTLFYVDNSPMTCDDEEQDIVFSFSGEPPLLPCEEGVSDCPEWEGVFCDEADQICKSCPFGWRPTDVGDGCQEVCSEDSEGYTTTCVSKTDMLTWCCPDSAVCSEVAGQCIDEETVCIYEMNPTEGDTGLYYTATCSYYMSPTNGDTQLYYTATCGYNLSQTTDANGNISVSFRKITDGVSTCKSNQYCRLIWTKKSWKSGEAEPKGFENDYVGEMYGVCVPMEATTGNAQPVYPASVGLLTRKEMKCGSNQYCRLIWTKKSWKSGEAEPKGFENDYVGEMHGVCVPMEATTGNAQPVYPASAELLKVKKGCDKGQWCNLRWPNSVCSGSIANDYVGLLYGGCIDITAAPGSAPCPSSMAGKQPDNTKE